MWIWTKPYDGTSRMRPIYRRGEHLCKPEVKEFIFEERTESLKATWSLARIGEYYDERNETWALGRVLEPFKKKRAADIGRSRLASWFLPFGQVIGRKLKRASTYMSCTGCTCYTCSGLGTYRSCQRDRYVNLDITNPGKLNLILQQLPKLLYLPTHL